MNDQDTNSSNGLGVNINFSFDNTQMIYLCGGILIAVAIGVFFGVFLNKNL
jgi:hypothetical protein